MLGSIEFAAHGENSAAVRRTNPANFIAALPLMATLTLPPMARRYARTANCRANLRPFCLVQFGAANICKPLEIFVKMPRFSSENIDQPDKLPRKKK